MLAKLFSQDPYEGRYIAKPHHLLYAVLLLGAGTVTFAQEWFAFGFVTFILGAALGVTIVLSMNWEKAIEYWEIINETARTMMSIKDPAVRNEIWKSMGYNFVPISAEIIETRRDENGVFQGMSRKTLPFNPAILQVVADKVLTSGKGEFPTENSPLGQEIPNYRKVKKYLKSNGYIVPTNTKNARLGYSFNHKGLSIMYEYASEGVKLELKRKRENNG